jgi:hypothetical protein
MLWQEANTYDTVACKLYSLRDAMSYCDKQLTRAVL